MKHINKGCKAAYSGVLFSMREYEDYKKLKKTVEQVRCVKREYMDTYYGCEMETFI